MEKKSQFPEMEMSAWEQTGEMDNLKKLHHYLSTRVYSSQCFSHIRLEVRLNLGYQLLQGNGSCELAYYSNVYYAAITF